MSLMFFFCLRVYQDVVNEHNHEFVQIFSEHLVHQIHEGTGALVNPKGIIVYSYNPNLEMNAVLGISEGLIFSW
jgi:hypothetical protein